MESSKKKSSTVFKSLITIGALLTTIIPNHALYTCYARMVIQGNELFSYSLRLNNENLKHEWSLK